jgi:beta-lactamase class A
MLEQMFADARAQGFVHVREVGTKEAVELNADVPVCLASVVKVIFAVAFARKVVAAQLDAAEQVTVPAQYRVGGSGTAGCAGPVTMALGDLALFMLSMSDNAATDVIFHRVGRASIDAVIADLELPDTYVRNTMESGARSVVEELRLPRMDDLDGQLRGADPAAIRQLSWIDPQRGNASTARDIGTLLEAVWTDRAAPPEACAMVRGWMAQVITTHGLAAAFDDGVTVASKTGTIPLVRNEAGVVTYPDGRQYVVAMFTRADELTERQPAIDAAIGAAARAAVDQLRHHTI